MGSPRLSAWYLVVVACVFFVARSEAAYPAYAGVLDSTAMPGEPGLVRGWAYEPCLPAGTPSTVEISVNGSLAVTLAADASRPDLVPAHAPSPVHGFEWHVPAPAVRANARVDVALVRACGAGSGERWWLTNSPGLADPLTAALPPLQALQGVDDQSMTWYIMGHGADDGGGQRNLQERYATIGSELKPGIRRYNFFWDGIEVVASQATPFGSGGCDAGFSPVPANESDRVARGYKRYHCYSLSGLAPFDEALAMDKAIGAVSAAIVYASPPVYRNPGCTGFPWGNAMYKQGCVPRDDAMDDWSDYVNLLAERYSPQLAHYVIWNEVASSGWMDMSPILPNRYDGVHQYTDAQMEVLTAKYADMLLRADAALRQHTRGAMLWVSQDHNWDNWAKVGQKWMNAGAVMHVNVRPFLDHLWPKVGINISWGVAVHPYDDGDPRHDLTASGVFTFATLNKVVQAYQDAQLGSVARVPPQGVSAQPQRLMYASEQGWPHSKTMNDTVRARNICFAQQLSMQQGLVAVTHNYFHQTPSDAPQGGQWFGLVPDTVFGNLTNAAGSVTYQAYLSTAPQRWGQQSNHYCCVQWHVGCKV